MTSGLLVADMASYLASTGWQRLPETWRGASVWENADGFEATVAARDRMDDSERRAWELLEVLAKVEGRPVEEIAEDIRSPLVDVQFVRTHPVDLPSGYVGLRTGLRALQAVRNLFDAAARAELAGPRHRYGGNHPTDVDRLLEHVQLGPSKAGSYELTLRVPVELPAQQELWGDQAFLPRRTSALLCRAVGAVSEATAVASSSGDFSAFDEAVDDGVSANLCKALSDLGGLRRQQRFEVGFRWARLMPSELPSTTVEFPDGAGVVIFEAAKKLEALAASGRVQITGLIQTTHDAANTDDRWRVRVRGELVTESGEVERSRLLWVRLSPADYQRALQAHGSHRPVRARGQVEMFQRRIELYVDQDGFEVLG